MARFGLAEMLTRTCPEVARLNSLPYLPMLWGAMRSAICLNAAAFGGGNMTTEDAQLRINVGIEPTLMVAFSEVEGSQVAHPAIVSSGAPPFMVHELCR
jgi:hypothetical protein